MHLKALFKAPPKQKKNPSSLSSFYSLLFIQDVRVQKAIDPGSAPFHTRPANHLTSWPHEAALIGENESSVEMEMYPIIGA